MAEAALAFGSNLGDSRAMIAHAMAVLDEMRGVSITRTSSFWRTPPWGVEDQPDFVNACALVATDLSPEALLTACKDLEKALGREEAVRWGPRLIDIDLLWMAGETRDSGALTLPHPRMTERAFVLVPLAEIAPALEIGGKSVRVHLDALAGEETARIVKMA
ncbi:2-amino-4-hydroxy-6-hydroxymethyldihydropteridine diphosphokinase [Henriciella aquimarina]|uniref:2-amino-4-hydroxy-6- hydroxymethyldihydropteridine diphosphokinase n=1 Tax=Henriciella aquimarina TaxID=545261 RepID=UPI000A016F58|nr:2-amino-4-hydroxy-6-hydroxymethyldihydropteridine diphosphokinase [Henriciella aquimarina]